MVRIRLTKAQARQIDAAREEADCVGDAAILFGYAQRHPWPDCDEMTMVIRFVTHEEGTMALRRAGVIEPRPNKRRRRARRKPVAKSRNR